MSAPSDPQGNGALGRRARSALLAAVLASCGDAGPGPGPAAPAEAPRGGARNALLVTLDTTRLDALDCYTRREGVTSNLDALARESVVYVWARTVAPITLAAHASMLTGLYPPRSGVRVNLLDPLAPAATTLAERARDAGLDTAAFVAAVVLDRRFGLDQGFARYDQPERPSGPGASHAELPAAEVVARAVRWLEERDRSRRFFLWVHLFDAHHPYDPPAEFRQRAGGNPYLGEVAAMDDALGRLFGALREQGAWDDTFVVVVADHGEGLGQHDEPNHGTLCYDTTLRVPLLVRYPDRWAAGRRVPDVASVADVHPTIVAALGLAPSEDLDGESLFRREQDPGRAVYFETYYGYAFYGWSPLAGVATRDAKYVHGPTPVLYRMPQDQAETDDVAATEPATVERLRATIEALTSRPALPRADAVTDPELAARIASLGYATASAATPDYPAPLAPTDLPSPTERLEEMQLFDRAELQLGAGDPVAATALLREVVAQNPRNVAALDRLALALMQSGRTGEAIEAFERALMRGSQLPQTHLNLAQCLAAEGDLKSAAGHLEQALALDPTNAAAERELTRVRAGLGERGD